MTSAEGDVVSVLDGAEVELRCSSLRMRTQNHMACGEPCVDRRVRSCARWSYLAPSRTATAVGVGESKNGESSGW